MKNFPCRYPGCTQVYNRPQSRGRHESQVHSLKSNGAAPIEKPISHITPSSSIDETLSLVRQALDSITKRETELTATVEKLLQLQSEARELARRKTILLAALESITGLKEDRAVTEQSLHNTV